MGGGALRRGDGRPQARDSLLLRGSLQRVQEARGGLHVRRVFPWPHPQSRRPLQQGDQVRRLPFGCAQDGGGHGRNRPLLPQSAGNRRGGQASGRRKRSAHLEHSGRVRPEQGPELFPLPAHAGAARCRRLPDRGPAKTGGAPSGKRGGPAFGRQKGFAGHLLRWQGGSADLPPAAA